MSKVPLTVAGAAKLREELQRLKTIERPKVVAAIAEARSHGDLSENAEYDAAKERQGFIEGRIRDVEGKLSNAQIIDPKLLDADGKTVHNFPKAPGYFSVAVPAGQDARLWTFAHSSGDRLLMTVPPCLARCASELLLPREVVERDRQ